MYRYNTFIPSFCIEIIYNAYKISNANKFIDCLKCTFINTMYNNNKIIKKKTYKHFCPAKIKPINYKFSNINL